MRAFALWSTALLSLVAIPLTGLLAFWALMAESGGKHPHPEVLPAMLWGITELLWTVAVSVRRRHLALPSARWRTAMLAAGLALTLVASPATLMFSNGAERTLIAPYVLLAVGCRVTRLGLVADKSGDAT